MWGLARLEDGETVHKKQQGVNPKSKISNFIKNIIDNIKKLSYF